MANEFIIKNGFRSQGNSEVTGSLNITGGITGSISGSIVAPGSTTQVVFNNGGVLGADSGFVYSGSNVGIGSTVNSFSNLSISKNMTGGLSVDGIRISSTIQSGSSQAQNFLSFPSTQATTFTLSNLYHFYALQGSFGAGSTVNRQTGFFVGANLIGATTNIGFLGSIPSGANRWNLYMDGTAINSLQGDTGIGFLTTPSARLQVRGSGATSSTTALRVENTNASASLVVLDNGFVGINTGSAAYPLEVSGSARVNGTLFTNAINFRLDTLTGIYPTDDGFNPANNGNLLRFQSNTLTVARFGYNFRNATSTRTWTSGIGGDVIVSSTYSPTSGTGIFNTMVLETTVNQTGGANGITRGLLVSPTLTAAADFRAIENTTGNNLFNSTSGNTYIGLSTNTGTAKLQIRGAGATSATNTFIVQNSTPSNLLTIQDNGQFTFSSPVISLATSQSAFTISQSISQSAVIGAQVYGVNITPTFFSTTASQTETAFRVAATFTGSAAATGMSNIIADLGATSVGSQFTVTDVTSGSIYMVNDVSGLPILEATSDWTVNMYNFPNKIFEKTGSNVNIYGTMRVSGSFILPLSQSATPQVGSAYWSGSFLFIYDGAQYRSASFA